MAGNVFGKNEQTKTQEAEHALLFQEVVAIPQLVSREQGAGTIDGHQSQTQ